MTEPTFRILRLDAGSEHWLGWAKKEVRRLINDAALPAFNRTWVLGDVTVRAQYHGESGVARLWLEAAGTERMAVWATLPNPVPWRGLQFLEEIPPEISLSTIASNVQEIIAPAPNFVRRTTFTVAFTDWAGVVASYVGTRTMSFTDYVSDETWTAVTITYASYPASSYQLSVYANPPPAPALPWYVLAATDNSAAQGDYMATTLVDGGVTIVRADPAAASGGLSFSYFSAIPRSRTSKRGAQVYTSSGELVASEGITRTSGSGISFATYVTSVAQSLWSWVRFRVASGTSALFSHVLDYTPPQDCIYPIPAVREPADVATPPELSLYTDLSDEAWRQQQYGAIQNSQEHRRQFLISSAESTLEQMRDKTLTLPARWDTAFKIAVPVSAHTKRAQPLTVTYVDEVVEDSGTRVRKKRTVTASYIGKATETSPAEQKEFVSDGYWTQELVVIHTHPADGAHTASTILDTYDNWYEPPRELLTEYTDEATPDVERVFRVFSYTPAAFFTDGEPRTTGLFWTGLHYVEGGYVADSTYYEPSVTAPPSMPFFTRAIDGDAFYAAATELIPPLVPYTNTVSGALPDFFVGYFREYPPVYDGEHVQTPEELEWLSSGLLTGGTVTAVFFAPVVGDRALGCFADGFDVGSGVTHIDVYGAATWAYIADSAPQFVLSSWRPASETLESVRVQLSEPLTELPGNALLIYGGIKWDDVKEDAKAQRKALNDPNDPAHDPLMKAVLDALKPPEPAP